jgi:hypothetical protein
MVEFNPMTNPEPSRNEGSCTDSMESLFFDYGVREEIPPERRKIDPSTIRWPQGVPKPWEKKPPAEEGGK